MTPLQNQAQPLTGRLPLPRTTNVQKVTSLTFQTPSSSTAVPLELSTWPAACSLWLTFTSVGLVNSIETTLALRWPPVALSSAAAFFNAGPRVAPFSKSATAVACGVPLCRNSCQFFVISAFAAASSAGAVAVEVVGGVLDGGGLLSVAAELLLLPPHAVARTAAARAGTTRRRRIMAGR